jgi:23S rRNA U2552 (ribose-2'-O)-methylase RlmE/FtsJ
MFKKTTKNCFKPVLQTTSASSTAVSGTTTTTPDDTHKPPSSGNGGPILSYFNHFLLPQVDLLHGGDGEYIPHELKLTLAPESYDCDVYISSSIFSHLCDIKEQIEKYQDTWDNIKKFTNPYEYIHTNVSGNKTNISKLRPLSRSFYKMIEIIKNNNILSQYNNTIVTRPEYKMGINTFHLAEGPGGFIEAISYLRGLKYQREVYDTSASSASALAVNNTNGAGTVQILKRHTELHDEYMKELEHLKLSRRIFENQKHGHATSASASGSAATATVANATVPTATTTYGNDRYYGMTLVNDDPICPGWKKTKAFLENHPNVIIETGADKTGNLISLENFQHCAAKYRNKMDIITADGGFDFSVDFNNQENMATQLILCEVFYALVMQKQGGTFILKIFDVFHKPTVDILYLLCYYYTNVSIIKPHTSRIANSEKYVVCQGFKIADSAKIVEQFAKLFPVMMSESILLTSLLPQEHDLYFLNKIEEMNAMVSFQQIENITSTLSIITNHRNAEKLEQYKKANVLKCIAWCEHYEIPYNVYHTTIQSTNIFLHRSVSGGAVTATASVPVSAQ